MADISGPAMTLPGGAASLLRRLRAEGILAYRQADRLAVHPSLERLDPTVVAAIRTGGRALLEFLPDEKPDRTAVSRAKAVREWPPDRRRLYAEVVDNLLAFGHLAPAAEQLAFSWVGAVPPPLEVTRAVSRSTSSSDATSRALGVDDPVTIASNAYVPAEAPEPSSEASSIGPSARFLADLDLTVDYIVSREDALRAVGEILRADESNAPFGIDIETTLVPELRQRLLALEAQRASRRSKRLEAGGAKEAVELVRSFGLNPHTARIRLVQVFAGSKRVHVFDIDTIGLEPLAPIWAKPLVAHNALYELKHLRHAGCHPTTLHCTMLAEHALTGHTRSLADLVMLLLRWQISKAEQLSDWGAPTLSPEQLAYAAIDAVAAWKAWRMISADDAFGRAARVYSLQQGALPAAAMMEIAGVSLDVDAHDTLTRSIDVDRMTALEGIRKILGPDVNPNSQKELTAALATFAPEDWPRTARGYLSTEKKTLLRYVDLPVVQELLSYRAVNHLVSSFGSALRERVNPVTHRLHASYNLAGARTGRIQTSQPNLQGIPSKADRRLRGVIVPAPGYVFVAGDYSQIELRVAALLSRDETMLAAYATGDDLHALTAAAIAKKDPADVTPDEREHAKRVNFGSIYGQQAKGLQERLFTDFGSVVTEDEAQRYLDAFFARYPQLDRYLYHVAATAMARGYSVTKSGRYRWYMNYDGSGFASSEAPRRDLSRVRTEPDRYSRPVAVNTPIQGTAAEVNLRALARVYAALVGTPATIVLNVHDEIVLECPDSFGPTAVDILRSEMLGAFLDILAEGESVTRDLVDVTIGTTWAACK